jgi:hypothetical protein
MRFLMIVSSHIPASSQGMQRRSCQPKLGQITECSQRNR